MVWHSYENQNIIILDEPMAEQLSQYLEQKESQLGMQILETIAQFEGFPLLKEALSPLAHSLFHLSDAVEEFGKKVNSVNPSLKLVEKEVWKSVVGQINQELWSYVEVLEGCVIELFQQLNQIGFEQWNVDLVRTATSIKDELTQRMDDLIWAMRRLEQQLNKYRRVCAVREGKWELRFKFVSIFSRSLDRQLEATVRKCNKYLNFRYRKFVERYTGYLQMCEGVYESMKGVRCFQILSSMDNPYQDKFKELCFLLKLWQKNGSARVLQATEPIRALRSCLTFERASVLFEEYLFAIRNAIFDKSRLIKQQFREMFFDRQSKQPLIDNIAQYRTELHGLKELIISYKKFQLHTDPGTRNWLKRILKTLVGKQLPKKFYRLHKLVHEIKKLEGIAANFQNSLERESEAEKEMIPNLQAEIDKHLHEMGQPLASKDLMRRSAKALLQSLQEIDEISSFDSRVGDFVCHTLCKAMCIDWKYHVLQGIPLLHQLYEVHREIFGVFDDNQHLDRLHKLQCIIAQLEVWIKNEETVKQAQKIDLTIHDIKAYLQDFLAYVQRLKPEAEAEWRLERFERPSAKAAQSLLQYLYVFSCFFSHLRLDDVEHRLMRKQLLFVDQYFEVINRSLNLHT